MILKTVACSLMAGAVLFAGATQARPYETIRASGKILVATGGEFPPFNYFEGRKLSGFEIELAQAVIRRMGLELEWKTLGFDSLLAGLQQDRWDMVISSHGITEVRAKAVTFLAPHYCSGGSIVSRDPTIRSAADLNGKRVAIQTGSTYADNVSKLTTPKGIKNYPQDRDARTALATGRADAWVTDKFVALEAIQAAPAAKLQLGELLFVEKIAGAVSKGNTELADAYNKALAEVMADGTYEEISTRYFGEDVRCPS
ncbi:ABC transporter substrate-binding protein [Phytopseudomonas flavescens]|nr:ABC transporter substrate-binding protein [Pseudomonas flavescens]